MSKFGENLKNVRISKNWSQKKLADEVGISQVAISQFENGERLPTPANITKFAKVLSIRREILVGAKEGNFEKAILLRYIKGLSPKSLRKISEYAKDLKEIEKMKR